MCRREFLQTSAWTALGAWLALRAAAAENTPPAGKPGRGPSSASMLAGMERLIPKLMDEAQVPGVGMAIVRDGKLIWRRGFGVKDSASRQPVDDDTVFEAASVSKTVFAYAVLQLCDQGILGLDTPLTEYAPKRFLEGDARLDRITARHVLSHSAGFQDWRSRREPLKIHFTPGEQFAYSGEGYFYLQSVMSHLAGRVESQPCASYEAGLEVCATDFDRFMKRVLLEPFGMQASGYVWSNSLAQHAASPHTVQGKPLPKGKPSAPDAARYGSAGGLHTTATDYARFLLEVIDPKPADAFRLRRSSWLEMLRPQIKLKAGEEIDGAGAWGLGWAIQERPTGDVIVHSGGQAGFRSLTMASVERKSGFVLFTNSDNGGRLVNDPVLTRLLAPLLAG